MHKSLNEIISFFQDQSWKLLENINFFESKPPELFLFQVYNTTERNTDQRNRWKWNEFPESAKKNKVYIWQALKYICEIFGNFLIEKSLFSNTNSRASSFFWSRLSDVAQCVGRENEEFISIYLFRTASCLAVDV
jgi:hypothetical protein